MPDLAELVVLGLEGTKTVDPPAASPIDGVAVAAMGTLSVRLSDCGIDIGFVEALGQTTKPALSARFLLVPKASGDKMLVDIRHHGCGF